MTEEEIRAEIAEAERLRNEINRVINQINHVNQENAQLEAELELAIENVRILIGNCGHMDNAVYEEMGWLSGVVGEADISTKDVYHALSELIAQYGAFKEMSTASKKLTQYNDEYFTKFSYYINLRRVSVGYVVGLDSNILKSDNARKIVEKAYLQNTDYWLAYAISSVMLWAEGEKEAAQRAMSKSLSLSYFNSCLFYLLINLRFNRIEAAKKWYVNYLDRVDTNNMGDEWQYLLQAYLFGAFGADAEFQELVAKSFKNMLAQVEVSTVDFAKKFTLKAIDFAEFYAHKTNYEFTFLGRTCSEYPQMKDLLSTAEKNIEIAKYYDGLADAESQEGRDLPQRIENVLYSLVNDYDEEEYKIVEKIKLNEAIISARGDIGIANENHRATFTDLRKKKNLGDLLMVWAFGDEITQTDVSVKRFSISLMKEAIGRGYEQFAEKYRLREKEKYPFDIDGCQLICGENDYADGTKKIEEFYNKNKLKNLFSDKQVLIYTGLCGLALLLLLILFAFFSPVILTFGILVGLAGSFLLWRRIVDLGKILNEKKRKSKLLLKQALDELRQWRVAYKDADSRYADILKALERF